MPTTKPYEILMRWNYQSQTWALHARSLTTLDDGTVIEGKAVPLVGLSDPAFTEVAALVSASKDNEIATLTTERDSLNQQLASMTTERDTALSEKASLQTQLDSASATNETLQSNKAELTADLQTASSQLEATTNQLTTANERIATLEARLAELTAEPEVPIVSRRQARLALLEMGLLETIEATVSQSPKAVQIEYEGEVWRRDNPTLVAMATTLGMNTEQIDQFFALAGTK